MSTSITVIITHNTIINEEIQPTDGFRVTLVDSLTEDVLETFEYDYSWNVEDAIQDALSGC